MRLKKKMKQLLCWLGGKFNSFTQDYRMKMWQQKTQVMFLLSITHQTWVELCLKSISTKEVKWELKHPFFAKLSWYCHLILLFYSHPACLFNLMVSGRWRVSTLRKGQVFYYVSEKLLRYFNSVLIFLGTIISLNNGSIHQWSHAKMTYFKVNISLTYINSRDLSLVSLCCFLNLISTFNVLSFDYWSI